MAKENSPKENFLCNNSCKLQVDQKRMSAQKSLQSSITKPKSSTSVEIFSPWVKGCKEELIGVPDKNNEMLDCKLQLSNKTKDNLFKKLQIDHQREVINNKLKKVTYEIKLFSRQKCPETSFLISSLIKERNKYIEQLLELDRKFSYMNLDSGKDNEINSFNKFSVQQMNVVEESDIKSVNKCLTEHKECTTQFFTSSKILNSDINDNGKNIKANEVVSNYNLKVKDVSILKGETNQSNKDPFDFEELD